MRYLGAVIFGMVFVLIGSGVTIGVAWWRLADGFQSNDLMILGFTSLWALLFTGGGLGALLGGLIAARRRFEIHVAGRQIRIDRYGPFGHREFVWEDGDIQDVQVVDSGTEVNGRKLRQVKIVSNARESLGLLTDRSESELSAVAACLRDALGLNEKV